MLVENTSREPLVTVMIITYNHARYISQALTSVLDQQTSFDFNVHVIEDCSTDGTQDILREFKKKFPDKIELYLNEKNIGNKVTQRNFIRGFKTLKSKYIAILEGDDYWCYPHKLEEQVRFLEKHPNYVACAHNTTKFYNDECYPSEDFLKGPVDRIHTIKEFILISSFFHTTGLVFRNVLKGCVPKHFISPYSCDIFINIAHAVYGDVYYFNKNWACYRQHAGGLFSNLTPLDGWLFNINGLRRYNEWLNYRYFNLFARSIAIYCQYVLSQFLFHRYKIAVRPLFKICTLFVLYTVLYWITLPLARLINYFKKNFYSQQRPVDLNMVDFSHFDSDQKWID